MMLRMHPEPKSKKKRLPFPSSTMMHVPAWLRVVGIGTLPRKEMRISLAPSSSDVGKKVLVVFTDAVGR